MQLCKTSGFDSKTGWDSTFQCPGCLSELRPNYGHPFTTITILLLSEIKHFVAGHKQSSNHNNNFSIKHFVKINFNFSSVGVKKTGQAHVGKRLRVPYPVGTKKFMAMLLLVVAF